MPVSFKKLKTAFTAVFTFTIISSAIILVSAPAMAGKHHHGRDIILGIGGLLVEKAIESEIEADEEAYDSRNNNPGYEDSDIEENEEDGDDTDYDQ